MQVLSLYYLYRFPPLAAHFSSSGTEQTLTQKRIHVRRACFYNLLMDISRAVPVYYDEGPQHGGFSGNR